MDANGKETLVKFHWKPEGGPKFLTDDQVMPLPLLDTWAAVSEEGFGSNLCTSLDLYQLAESACLQSQITEPQDVSPRGIELQIWHKQADIWPDPSSKALAWSSTSFPNVSHFPKSSDLSKGALE